MLMPAEPPRVPGPGRATGERLLLQRGRLAPRGPALRASHSRACPPHYDHSRQPSTREQSWPFLDRCYPAAGEAAGPGGAPAAKRGRTTWRRAKTTATIGHEEGPRPRFPGQDTAPEGHLTSAEEGRRKPLTQRGIR